MYNVGLPIINKTYAELKNEKLVPFINAINNNAKIIMVGHLALPKITGDNTPATLSKKIVTDILKNDLGYQGLIITDGLNIGALTKSYSDEEIYIGAINANNAAKEVNLTLTKDSKIMLTSNINVNSLTNGDYDNNNIDLNGYTLYINNEEMNKENIKHLNEKNDKMYIVLGFIIGAFLGYSVIYLYFKTNKKKK